MIIPTFKAEAPDEDPDKGTREAAEEQPPTLNCVPVGRGLPVPGPAQPSAPNLSLPSQQLTFILVGLPSLVEIIAPDPLIPRRLEN